MNNPHHPQRRSRYCLASKEKAPRSLVSPGGGGCGNTHTLAVHRWRPCPQRSMLWEEGKRAPSKGCTLTLDPVHLSVTESSRNRLAMVTEAQRTHCLSRGTPKGAGDCDVHLNGTSDGSCCPHFFLTREHSMLPVSTHPGG